jgi:glycosyltransferase involved in cell wall biosynthesis
MTSSPRESRAARRRVLFVSYDGVLAGPGRTQSIPYVTGLAARGHDMALFSYEDPARLDEQDRIAAVRAELGDVPWTFVPRRGRSLRDLRAGLGGVRAAYREHGADLLHARGYVPAFLALTLRIPFLFDMRGFWPDERVDGGLWSKESLGYRAWKRIERRLCRRARAVVVLTERAKGELGRLGLVPPATPVHVIPTCADLERFRPVPEAERPAEVRGVRRYLILGGTQTWYLRDEMLDLAARALARDTEAVLHVLTEDPHEPVRAGLRERGLDPARWLVTSVPGAAVPGWISGAEAGIALIRSCWSKGASCPTKLGELLGCGVPVLMNAGIGDVDTLLGGERVGATVAGFDAAAYDAALDAVEALHREGREELAARCCRLAEREFSLTAALDRYDAAYEAARNPA